MSAASDAHWRWPTREWRLLVAVYGLVVLSRLPFLNHGVESFDAVNYMLAIGHFDMRLGQPQPPGYILYILLARAANLVSGGPHAALLLVSSVFSGAAVIAMYLAGRDIFNRRTGALAAALLAVTPFFWFTGSSAVPYAPDLAFATTTAWLCYREMQSAEERIPWAAALALGLAGAFRLQTLLFLFPLFLYSIRKRQWKNILTGCVCAGGVFGAFFVPSVYASGGPAQFLRALFAIVPILSGGGTMAGSSYAQKILANGMVTGRHLLAVLGELLLPLALTGLIYLPEKRTPQQRQRLIFLLLWILPTWLVCLLIGPGNVGTIQVTTAPWFLLAAFSLAALTLHPRWKWTGWALSGVILVVYSVVFTLLPYRPFGNHYRAFHTYDALVSTAADYREKTELIRQFPAQESLVIAREFRLVQYYLPEYRVLSVPTIDPDDTQRFSSVIQVEHNQAEYLYDVTLDDVLPAGTRYVIFYDAHLLYFPLNGITLQPVTQGNTSIHVLELEPGRRLGWTAQGLSLQP